MNQIRRYAISALVVTLFAMFLTGTCSATEPVGIILKYEIDQANAPVRPRNGIEILVKRENIRLGNLGVARVLNDKQFEVSIYGNPNESDLYWIKQLAGAQGVLELRILANPYDPKDRPIIELAKAASPTQKVIQQDGNDVAEWITYVEAEFGPADKQLEAAVKRSSPSASEILVLLDSLNITGDYLDSAKIGVDEKGKPAIHFTLTRDGGMRLLKLTSENAPAPETPNLYHRLGIILDKRIITAPTIRSAIGPRAMISGNSMTGREAEVILKLFDEGMLPCPVRLVDEKHIEHNK